MWWAWLLNIIKGNIVKIIGILADLLVIAFVLYSIYMVFNPKPTTTQHIQTQIIQQVQEHKVIGVEFNLWKLRLSLGL